MGSVHQIRCLLRFRSWQTGCFKFPPLAHSREKGSAEAAVTLLSSRPALLAQLEAEGRREVRKALMVLRTNHCLLL